MSSRPVVALALAATLVVAGCAAPRATPGRPDPAFDRLGWEGGYWYDEPLAVTREDGLNETELQAVVARTRARVERIRELEYTDPVSVEVISRAEFRNRDRDRGRNRPAAYHAWRNQVWEALLLVGEDRNVSAAFESTYGSSVVGFYTGDRGIVLISDGDSSTIDRATLVHELVHALQDQHFGFGGRRRTIDGRLARDALTEGEANYVPDRYAARCERTWDCLPRPNRTADSGRADVDQGVFLTIFAPYAAGPGFVRAARERGGWPAVDALYDRFPASTEQVIHPETYPNEAPANVTVRDRSSGEWSRFDLDRPASDTAGEAAIYAMLRTNGALGNGSRYNYSHPASAGWGGDAVVPYRNGSGGYGYVWKLVWDTEADAREFADAYRGILQRRADREPAEGVYVLPASDPFGDAFRVRRTGDTVRIVNGPTVSALAKIGGKG